MTETLDILGVHVTVTNLQLACETIEDWIVNKTKTYICLAPVATIVDCQDDSKYRDIVNQAGMITPDGMPLVWTGKLKGIEKIGRTYGPDLMLRLCDRGQRKKLKHFFYGGTEDGNARLIENLKAQFPEINIAGSIAPPFQEIDQIEKEDILEKINQAVPDILWIGLGSPKQDYWMHNHREKLNMPVMIGVGAAFDFIAGTKKQAPRWMRKVGLEWFFRLCSEPKRLWKRYIIGNSRFIFLILRSWFRSKLKKVNT